MKRARSRRTLEVAPNLPRVFSVAEVRERMLACAAIALAMLWLPAFFVDLPLARFVHEHRMTGDLRKLLMLSEAFAYGGSVMIIIAIAALLDKKRRWPILPRLLVCSLGSGLVADSLKYIVARERPKHANLSGDVGSTFVGWFPPLNYSLPRKWDHTLQSFPSAHTATAVGLAICLSLLYPRGRYLFIALGILASVQRIDSSSHFLSDTLAGAAIGCTVCLIALRYQHQRHDRPVGN